jgi:cellulose synthase/poly-beta-1,6-N-acetylglucosamine synthase-like glycosyltransferase
LISFLNFIFNKIYLKKLKNSLAKETALVSVLIPVRNEEKNIGNLLNDLIN